MARGTGFLTARLRPYPWFHVLATRRDALAWVHGGDGIVAWGRTTSSDGSVNSAAWRHVVAQAVSQIVAGDLDKIVLARDIEANLIEPIDVRWPLARLAADYPSCWTSHIDGFFGSTPEMLVRLERGLITSRVLAGAIRRTGDDLALAGSLARSSRDLEEHEYAVFGRRSARPALHGYECAGVAVR